MPYILNSLPNSIFALKSLQYAIYINMINSHKKLTWHFLKFLRKFDLKKF